MPNKNLQITASELLSFALGATDGEIGRVTDVYFDDQTWKLRYLVVETGSWLFNRKVLIAPQAVKQSIDVSTQILPVNLTKDEVKNSPDIDTDQPVSRQQEAKLYRHYAWPAYAGPGISYLVAGMTSEQQEKLDQAAEADGFDQHLRSFKHISQYEVHIESGQVGLVSDLLIDLADWSILFLQIDGPDKISKLPINVITAIDWNTFQIRINAAG